MRGGSEGKMRGNELMEKEWKWEGDKRWNEWRWEGNRERRGSEIRSPPIHNPPMRRSEFGLRGSDGEKWIKTTRESERDRFIFFLFHEIHCLLRSHTKEGREDGSPKSQRKETKTQKEVWGETAKTVEEKPHTSTLSKPTPPSAGGNYQMFICQKTCFITSHLPLPSHLAPSNTVRMKSNVMVETKHWEARGRRMNTHRLRRTFSWFYFCRAHNRLELVRCRIGLVSCNLLSFMGGC